MLDVLGIHFGSEEQLLRPNPANPTGFWEHEGIIALNDEILARLGGSWHSPPDLAMGWATSAELDDLRARGSDLLRTQFGSQARWGWKDPRTCLTVPFWESLLPATRYVVCLREPAEAARSLVALPWARRRLSEPFSQAMDLWLRYTSSALAHTEGRPRLLVLYDDVLSNCEPELARLAAFLGEREPPSPKLRRAVSEFVRPELRHQDEASAAPHGGQERPRHPADLLYAALKARTSCGLGNFR
jgi:hypothetical protein